MSDRPIRVPLIPECSACIVHSINRFLPVIAPEFEKQTEYVRLVYSLLAEGFKNKIDPLPLSIKIYSELYSLADMYDPYKEVKQESNRAALEALPFIDERISKFDGCERLRAVLAAAIAGNMIDFNTAGHEPVLERLEVAYSDILSKGFQIDDSAKLWEMLVEKTGTLAVLADNAGESILDIPLLRFLNEMNWDIVYVVKGKPMINDVTADDIEGTEIEKLATILSSGAWAHGVPRDLVSEEFMNTMAKMDLVISKGQANIESFPEIQDDLKIPTFYVTRAKCPHISRIIGAEKGDNVVLYRCVY